jgi:ribosome-binding factor A
MELSRSGDRGRGRRDAARKDRKTKQLCRQVFQAVSLALAGECDDEVLRDLTVESVTPAPNASRLLVCVALPPARPGETLPSPQMVMERLTIHRARLRRCVAAVVTRKRAPELTFLPVAPGSLLAQADDQREVTP